MMIIDYVCIFIFTILSYLNPQFWDLTRTVYMLGKHLTTELYDLYVYSTGDIAWDRVFA